MSDLKLQIILSALDKATAPFKNVHKSAQALARGVVETKGKLKDLEKQQKLIDNFKQLKVTLTQNTQALAAAKAKAEPLAAAISKVGVPTRAMQKDFKAAAAEVAKLSTKQTELTQKTHASRSALSAAGIKTRDLASAQSTLSKNTTAAVASISKQEAALKRASEAQAKHAALSEQYNKGMGTRDKIAGVGAKTMGVGVAVGLPVIKTVQDFMTLEDVMVGVARQVPGLKDSAGNFTAEYGRWVENIKRLSTELPVSTTEIGNLVTAGARMEIPKAGLEDFVRTTVKLAVAFDAVNPEEMAENFGKVQKNFKLSAAAGKDLADVINYLDDNAISKGDAIIGFLNRVGGIANSAKISSKQVAALGSTLMTLGAAEEDAATAVTTIFSRVAAATKSKPVTSALNELGLDASKVQKGMVTDAQATMFQIVESIKKLPEEKRIGVMVDLVGRPHTGTLSKLVNNTEEWERQIQLTLDPAALGSMDREFDTRARALSAKWQIFKNRIFNTSSQLGAALAVPITEWLERLGAVLERANVWAKQNPVLVSTIMRVVAVCAILLVVIGGLMLSIAAFMTPLIIVRHGIGLLGLKFAWFSSMIGGVGKAFMWLGRAFLMNPIGLAITAIIVVVVLLYTHWETVKNAIISGWQWLDSVFADNPILNALFPIIGITRLIINHWETVKIYLGAAWAAIKAVAVAAWDGLIWYISNISPLAPIIQNWEAILTFLRGLKNTMLEIGKHIIDGLIAGIKSGIKPLKDLWDDVNNMMPAMFRKKLEIKSPSRIMAALGGHVMEGLGVGISRGQGILANTFGRAVDFFTEPLGVPAFPVPKLAVGGVGASGGGAGGFMARPQGGAPVVSGGDTYYITVQAPTGDGRDIASQIEKIMAKIEADKARRARSGFSDKE